MEINHLKHFYFVSKFGGFTKASKELNVQQPSISKTISQLELQLGVKLFVREKRGAYLTDIGKEIYKCCDKIFQEIENIEYIANEQKFFCSGELKFCASEPISSYFVPKVHKPYLDNNPDVVPACYSGFSTDLLERIESGEFEFGLFFHIPILPEKLKVEILQQVPYELVIKFSEKNNNEIIESFIGSREIDDVRTKIFPTIARMNRDNKKTNIKISSNSLTSHKNMVLDGLGVSVLPEIMVYSEIKSKQLARLYPKGTFKFPLKLVSKKTHLLSRNARAWIQQFRETNF